MKPGSHSLTAVILKRTPYGEADVIVTFFSREQGKLSGMARHAKRSVKRFGNVLASLALVRLEVTASPGRELVRLDRGEPITVFEGAAGDPLRLGLAGRALELVDGVQAPLDPLPELFDLLLWLLGRLDRGERVEEASFIFELRLLRLAGFGPNLTVCPHCGRRLADFPQAALDPGQGGLVCPEAGPEALPVSTGTLKVMDRALSLPLGKIDRLRAAPRVLAEAEPFLGRYVVHVLGRELKSTRFLDQIKKGRRGG
jgi:DNA repair protein RecO (recombination protein O)